MKKIFISLLAVAALAACTKSEVEYTPAGEIGFAPVASNVTKSVAGYNGDTFDGVFPTNVNLYVFANASNDAGTAWDAPYFENAKFVYNESKDVNTAVKGAYAGDPTRYWPNVKTLKFAGYSDACGVAKTAVYDIAANTITISSYTQDNGTTYSAEGANDLMWFPTTSAYTKQENEVVANMQHACSWITINVYGDDVTANNWTLNSLQVKGIAHTGNVVCGASAATWNTLSNNSDEYYYNDGTTFKTTVYEYATTANNFIVIPQTPTSLDVTYTYTSQDAVGSQAALTLTETKNVPLKYDDANTAWQSGYHYIYNVKITATEILIDPVVVDWTNTSVTPETTI